MQLILETWTHSNQRQHGDLKQKHAATNENQINYPTKYSIFNVGNTEQLAIKKWLTGICIFKPEIPTGM
jgi:hypothetical protein